jgi:hypothetical protein
MSTPTLAGDFNTSVSMRSISHVGTNVPIVQFANDGLTTCVYTWNCPSPTINPMEVIPNCVFQIGGTVTLGTPIVMSVPVGIDSNTMRVYEMRIVDSKFLFFLTAALQSSPTNFIAWYYQTANLTSISTWNLSDLIYIGDGYVGNTLGTVYQYVFMRVVDSKLQFMYYMFNPLLGVSYIQPKLQSNLIISQNATFDYSATGYV